MALLTTTLGAYPKPVYAPVPGGFDATRSRWVRTIEQVAVTAAAVGELDRAVREVVSEQAAIGIDIATDGEIRRQHYIYYHLRHLDGFDFTNLVTQAMRDGGWCDDVPVVTGPIAAGAPFLVRDWQVAQAVTDRPIKMTMPGPSTILASTADAHYGDADRLGAALADALNVEIRRLAAAGCGFIQIDEPVLARDPAQANATGIGWLGRCFHGVPDGVQRIVHICCGYPSALDQAEYPKADSGSYDLLADAVEASPIDAVSIEDAHRHVDLRLLERFNRTAVILGAVDIARTRVEPQAEIVHRLRRALEHIDAARLIVAPDCGLSMLPRSVAVAKLEQLVAAARVAA